MMWYKGIRIILDALARLSAQGIDFRMVFIGDGKDRKEIVDYAQLLPCSGKVLFLPPIHDREHIRAWYCRADLFLFPSTFDTNGLVVREAAACGLASVLIENSCAAEGIVHNRNGFLVQENAQALADELFRLLSQMQLLHRVGECAQREIYLSWADAVARAYQRYFTVIDNYRIKRKPRPEQVPEDSSRAATLFARYSKLVAGKRPAFLTHFFCCVALCKVLPLPLKKMIDKREKWCYDTTSRA